ncbi:TonB-dependent receptor [uncultured Duncaniella sp.]|uniref:SusC/RagA family TonB-linked outer membrane protein n=5 Tax=uncultured Duncaniella sp. TaxID=2768039 RepID=UPI0025A678F9|nr:TonB-dependent receptor [uncultured Duncaniella sp.]
MRNEKSLKIKSSRSELCSRFGRICFSVLFAVFAIMASAQDKSVSGTVIDETGEPVIGATVMVKGTKNGTATDIDGKYALTTPPSATLVFSYVGYTTQEIPVGGRNVIDVTLKESRELLDEVVVVGYGTVRRRDLTGAVSSMKNSDVVVAPTNNVMEALQGKIAGMDITKSSGETGSDVNILLRGSRSIYGSNEPLFIIDGIPGIYSQVNPSDIESIDVLKDASSTAIYGSAGANGVVIITTKRGEEGKAIVNFDAYYGFSGDVNYKHGMLGDEWLAYHREAYKYINGDYPTDNATLMGNPEYTSALEEGKWIDWVDLASGRRATTQKYALSVSGGTQKARIFASTSYSKEEGLLPNDELDRYTLRLNADMEINKYATIGFTSNLTYSDHDRGVKNTFTKSLTAFPLGDAFDEDGNLNHRFIDNQDSPLGDFIENQFANNTKSTYINSIGYLDITPFKGFKFRSQISAILSNSRLGQYWGAQATANQPSYAKSPFAQKTHNNNWAYTWENILSYNADIKDHSFGAQFITSYNKNTNEQTIAGSGGFDVDTWQFHRLLSGSGSQYTYSDYSRTQKMSYAFRVNYNYKGRYLLTFSNRWDGVSWFSEGSKWDSFPAGAVAWRLSDEEFMESTRNWLSNAKLRVSYGITGNSGGTGAYVTQTQAYLYPNGGVTVGGKPVQFAQYTGTYAGSTLGWEKSYNWNVGLDFGVLNNRIDGSIEWFRTETKGLLYKRTVPITDGVTGWGSPLSRWENLARTENHGFEFTINSRNIVSKDFNWSTTLTATWSKERIKELPGGNLISESLFVGAPIKSIYGWKYAGIWGTDDDAELMKKYKVEPGYIKIETIENNGDGGVHAYGDNDRMILGHQNPNWILGLNNTFKYRDFDLSVFMMGRFGQTIQSNLLGYYDAKNSRTTNQISGVDYWTEDNQGAYYPRPGTGDKQSKVMPSLRVVDGSFAKIKNVTFGYTLPGKLTQKALVERMRLYFTAYNPWIIMNDSKLDGIDPETGGSDAFPTYKQFVFGINLTL